VLKRSAVIPTLQKDPPLSHKGVDLWTSLYLLLHIVLTLCTFKLRFKPYLFLQQKNASLLLDCSYTKSYRWLPQINWQLHTWSTAEYENITFSLVFKIYQFIDVQKHFYWQGPPTKSFSIFQCAGHKNGKCTYCVYAVDMYVYYLAWKVIVFIYSMTHVEDITIGSGSENMLRLEIRAVVRNASHPQAQEERAWKMLVLWKLRPLSTWAKSKNPSLRSKLGEKRPQATLLSLADGELIGWMPSPKEALIQHTSACRDQLIREEAFFCVTLVWFPINPRDRLCWFTELRLQVPFSSLFCQVAQLSCNWYNTTINVKNCKFSL